MKKSVGHGVRTHRRPVAAAHQQRANRPELLEPQIAVQTQSAHVPDGGSESPDRDAAFRRDGVAIDRAGRVGGDVVVNSPDDLRVAMASGQQIRLAGNEQLVDRDQQLFPQRQREIGHLQQFGRCGCDLQNPVNHASQRGQRSLIARKCPNLVPVVEPVPIRQIRGKDDGGVEVGCMLDETDL